MSYEQVADEMTGTSARPPAQQLVVRLEELGLTLSTAESLSGGLLSSAVVDVPGASSVLRGGIVSYTTEVKNQVLGVDQSLLDSGGPVQPEVALQMARGVSKLLDSSMALSTTGVAGPGDSQDGPQGLVYVAAIVKARGEQEAVELVSECHFEGDRDHVRKQAVCRALTLGLEALSLAT